jgi:DinB superfamily
MSAITLLRWQFQRAHELLAVAIPRLPAKAVRWRPRGTVVPVAACYAQVVVCEDLAVNGVLAKGAPLALSTWAGRTGLSEMPPPIGTADWHSWAHHVRLDPAQLQPYARAVHASTDAYIAALPEDALNPARADGPGCLLSALLLTVSMRTGEIACLLALERGPATNDEGIGHHTAPSVMQ